MSAIMRESGAHTIQIDAHHHDVVQREMIIQKSTDITETYGLQPETGALIVAPLEM